MSSKKEEERRATKEAYEGFQKDSKRAAEEMKKALRGVLAEADAHPFGHVFMEVIRAKVRGEAVGGMGLMDAFFTAIDKMEKEGGPPPKRKV